MARQEITNPMDDNNLNKLNFNFIELYQMNNQMNAILNDLVLNSGGDSNLEVVQARGGKPTLNARLDDFTSQLNETATKAELAHKPNRYEVFLKQNGININNLDEETRQAILENNNIDIDYVLGKDNVKNVNLADYTVSPKKTTYFKETKNLYHGDLVDGFVLGLEPNNEDINGMYREPSDAREKSCIIEVIPGETYTITSYGGDRRRYAVYEEYPKFGDKPVELIEAIRSGGDIDGSSKTFTNPTGAHYLAVYLSSTGAEVKCQVERGEGPTEYEPPYKLEEEVIPLFSGEKILDKTINERKVSFLNKTKNLYHGELVPGFVYDQTNGSLSGVFGDPRDNPHRVCVIEVIPNVTYTITPYGGDRKLYAVYESYPKYGDDSVELVNGTSSNTNPVTFTNPSNGNYLVIYLSSQGFDVKCQVEVGGETTEYEPPYVLGNNIGLNTINVTSDRESIREKHRVPESFPLNYKPLPQLPANEDGEFNANTAKHTDIYNLYDELMDKYPNYITREIPRVDDYGNELRVYKLTPPEMASDYGDYKSNRLKMIWTSGVHGNERTYPYTVFKIVEEICERKGDHIILDFLRKNTEIIIVPVVTPSAYDDDTRNKRNGVNINRNFDNDWVSSSVSGSGPFSEPESKVVRDVVEDNQDAGVLLDFHNYFSNNPHVFWASFEPNFPNKDKEAFYYNYLVTITEKLSQEYEWFTYSEIPAWMAEETRPSVESHGEMNGVFSHTVEIKDHIPQKPNNKKLDEHNVEFAMIYAVNMVAGIINAM